MRRAYYDDPLKAAWMAKHFGMFFTGDYCVLLMSPAGMIQHIPKRFVIHPESMHLLKPKDGDMIDWRGPRGVLSTDATAADAVGHQILQRDGQPFFWPEFEDVAESEAP